MLETKENLEEQGTTKWCIRVKNLSVYINKQLENVVENTLFATSTKKISDPGAFLVGNM